MKAMSLALVAVALFCLAGCPEEKAKPDTSQAKPAPTGAQSAAPAAKPDSTGGGW